MSRNEKVFKVKFLNSQRTGTFGREYTYLGPNPSTATLEGTDTTFELGEVVIADTARGESKAVITMVNVPWSEIAPWAEKGTARRVRKLELEATTPTPTLEHAPESNQGYVTVHSFQETPASGIVLAYKETAAAPWVTWGYRDDPESGTRDRSYFWGHYHKTEEQARNDFMQRIRGVVLSNDQ